MSMKLRLEKNAKQSLMDILKDESKKKGDLEEKLESFKDLVLELDNKEVGMLLNKVMNCVSVKVFNYLKLKFSHPINYKELPAKEITDNDITVSLNKAHEFLQIIHSMNMSNSLNQAYEDIAMGKTYEVPSLEEMEKNMLHTGDLLGELIIARDKKTSKLFIDKNTDKICRLLNEALYIANHYNFICKIWNDFRVKPCNQSAS